MRSGKFDPMEIIRFGIVGGAATAVHYAIYLVLVRRLGPSVSYTIGYIISFCINFYLSNRFTFRTNPSLRKGLGFALSHLVNYILHISLLALFLHCGLSGKIAPLAVFAVVIPVNFILVRLSLKKL